jgi:hypothetical protein
MHGYKRVLVTYLATSGLLARVTGLRANKSAGRNNFRVNVTQKLMARSNTALLIKSLFLRKVVPEVIDPVMGSFQGGCIQRQIRTIEATNIRMMNLLLVIHPSLG